MQVKNDFFVWGTNTEYVWERSDENIQITERGISMTEDITEWGPSQFVFFTKSYQGEWDWQENSYMKEQDQLKVQLQAKYY